MLMYLAEAQKFKTIAQEQRKHRPFRQGVGKVY